MPTHAGGLGGEQVEGVRSVLELLQAGRRSVREVWMSRSDWDGTEQYVLDELESSHPDPVGRISRLAATMDVPVRFVDKIALHHAAVTDSPQGVVAWAAPLHEVDVEEMSDRKAGSPAPFLLVLEGVTDPRNVGALARTALSAGATGMVLPRHRGAHVTPAAAKAAAGAVEHLAMAVVPGVPNTLTRLAELGVWSVGLDADAGLSLYDVGILDEPVALVLGAEGRGLSRLAARRCDLVASIPQVGPLGSLNVAAAGAVACFEVARRRALGGAGGAGGDSADR